MEACRRNKDKIVLGISGFSLIGGGVLIIVLSALFLQEPVFVNGDSSGMIIGFTAVAFAVPGMFNLIQFAEKSAIFMIQLYAAVELICLMASGTTFVALRSGIVKIDTTDCSVGPANATNCICSGGDFDKGCDEIDLMQTMTYWITGLYMFCLLLISVDILRALNIVCCTDEIPDIPGVIDSGNN